MSSFSLDDIRAAADVKYASTDIELGDQTVRLLNPLRLSKENRAALLATQKNMTADDDSDEDVDQVEHLEQALRIVAERPAQAEALLTAIGGDLAVLAQVFETYGKATQVGEASASAS